MSPTIPAYHMLNSVRDRWRVVGQKTRTRANRAKEAIRGAQAVSVPDTPSPEYAEPYLQGCSRNTLPKSTSYHTMPTHISADPYPILTTLVERQGEEEKGSCNSLFYWGMVQIMAVTFSANFQRLQAAIENDETKKSMCPRTFAPYGDLFSILTEHGQAGLEQLCTLVRSHAKNLRRNRWPSVCKWDKVLLIRLVLKPAQRLHIPADYALEVLGRYKPVEAGGKAETMIDYWIPSYHRIRPNCTSPMLDLGDTLASHASLIEFLNLKEEKAIVLEDAFVTFQKERGMDKLQNSKELQEETTSWTTMCIEGFTSTEACFWPVSNRYFNLAEVLRTSGNMPDLPGKIQRSRLRKERKCRSYFQRV
jgi:hypothetical protein